MQNRSYRITPLGYIIICTLIFAITWMSSTLIRKNQVKYQIAYAINNVNAENDKSLDIDFSFTTVGDAVLYEQKSIESNNLVQFRKDFIALDGDFKFQEIHFHDMELYMISDGIISTHDNEHSFMAWNDMAKIWHNQTFDLKHLYQIMKPSEKEKIIIKQRDLDKILSSLEQDIIKEGDNYIVKLSINDWLDIIDQLALELTDHPDIEKSISNRYSAFYDAFAHHQLLKDYNLNSRVLFSKIVDLNDDLYGTIHAMIVSLESSFNHFFKEDSTLSIKITIKDDKITHFILEGQLHYKSCDAYESIYFSIVDQPIIEKHLPETYSNDLQVYIKDVLQTMK